MKYVIATTASGMFVPVVFPEECTHAYIGKALRTQRMELQSAGFVYQHNGRWTVSKDKSETLKLGPAIGDDFILNAFLVEGFAGLDLANVVALLRMKGQ